MKTYIKISGKEIEIPEGLFRCSICQRPATKSIAEVKIVTEIGNLIIKPEAAKDLAKSKLNQDPMKYQIWYCGYHYPL